MNSTAGVLPDSQPCRPHNSFDSINRMMPMIRFGGWTGRLRPWVVVFGHLDALGKTRHQARLAAVSPALECFPVPHATSVAFVMPAVPNTRR